MDWTDAEAAEEARKGHQLACIWSDFSRARVRARGHRNNGRAK